MSLLDPRPRVDPEVSARVRAWARQCLGLPIETGLAVTELSCSDPGCPSRETVLLISPPGRPTRQHKLPKAAGDVTRADLEALAPYETKES